MYLCAHTRGISNETKHCNMDKFRKWGILYPEHVIKLLETIENFGHVCVKTPTAPRDALLHFLTLSDMMAANRLLDAISLLETRCNLGIVYLPMDKIKYAPPMLDLKSLLKGSGLELKRLATEPSWEFILWAIAEEVSRIEDRVSVMELFAQDTGKLLKDVHDVWGCIRLLLNDPSVPVVLVVGADEKDKVLVLVEQKVYFVELDTALHALQNNRAVRLFYDGCVWKTFTVARVPYTNLVVNTKTFESEIYIPSNCRIETICSHDHTMQAQIEQDAAAACVFCTYGVKKLLKTFIEITRTYSNKLQDLYNTEIHSVHDLVVRLVKKRMGHFVFDPDNSDDDQDDISAEEAMLSDLLCVSTPTYFTGLKNAKQLTHGVHISIARTIFDHNLYDVLDSQSEKTFEWNVCKMWNTFFLGQANSVDRYCFKFQHTLGAVIMHADAFASTTGMKCVIRISDFNNVKQNATIRATLDLAIKQLLISLQLKNIDAIEFEADVNKHFSYADGPIYKWVSAKHDTRQKFLFPDNARVGIFPIIVTSVDDVILPYYMDTTEIAKKENDHCSPICQLQNPYINTALVDRQIAYAPNIVTYEQLDSSISAFI